MRDVIKIKRHKCEVPGCDKFAQNTRTALNPRSRKSKWVREEYGVEEGYVCATHHLEYHAKQNGFVSITPFKNSKHPSRQYRKDYCENIDSRLGYKCTTSPPPQELIEKYIESGYYEGWLDVDHIDGNPSNNDPENFQTLCKCCHNFKGAMEKDYSTPGRKALNLTSNGTFRTT